MNSITKYFFTREKSKSVIVSHLKTQPTHGISALIHGKTKNHIVSHLKTQPTHGISGLIDGKTKNHIVSYLKTLNQTHFPNDFIFAVC